MRKTACWMMAAAALVIGTPVARAGSLEPNNAPAPTMHTLEEIYQKLTNVEAAVSATPGSNVIGADGALVIAIPDGLYTGSKTATAVDADLVASNIRAGVTIFGITGTYADCDPSPGGTNYLVIDLSGGPSAGSYPVSYLADVPVGGWTEEHKTTKMVLRRIPAGTFTMGSPTNELGRFSNETQHEVTISQPFYMGVFEVTQQQWERVMGTWPSYFNNATYRDSRPVEFVSYNTIRGSSAGAGWPESSEVDSSSFMGKLRARTGKAFDLPTESQWEYAGRAGTTTALNSGNNLTNTSADTSMDAVGRYQFNHPGGYSTSSNVDTNGGTATVGSYQANAWGLYDIHGNVFEWCLDWNGKYPGTVTDPVGASSAEGSARVYRGGSWTRAANNCRVAFRDNGTPGSESSLIGFRVVLPPGQ